MDLIGLKKRIAEEKYKIISFDIFDTLIYRMAVNPQDILKLVGRRCGYDGDFLTMRRIAEKEARKNRSIIYDEITYDEIYNTFLTLFDFSEETVERFKKAEYDIEKKYLFPRKAMLEVFNYAKSIGKKIIITSDIYLDRKFIEEVLDNTGYSGYDELFLSSEYKICKNTGKLYAYIIKKYKLEGISAEEILHLGDNEKSDVDIARKMGLSVEFIPRVSWLYGKNNKLYDLYRNSVINRFSDDCFLIGWAIDEIYDDPFHINEKQYFDGNKEYFIKYIIVPLILSYVDELIKQAPDNCKIVFEGNSIPLGMRIIDCIKKAYRKNINTNLVPTDVLKKGETEGDIYFVSEEMESILCTINKEKKVRLASLYVTPKQYYKNENSSFFCENIIDIDTERDVPIMLPFIKDVMGGFNIDATITNYQRLILNSIRDLIWRLGEDINYLYFDCSNFAEFFYTFLMEAKEQNVKIFENIKIGHTLGYNSKVTKVYEDWVKNKR